MLRLHHLFSRSMMRKWISRNDVLPVTFLSMNLFTWVVLVQYPFLWSVFPFGPCRVFLYGGSFIQSVFPSGFVHTCGTRDFFIPIMQLLVKLIP